MSYPFPIHPNSIFWVETCLDREGLPFFLSDGWRSLGSWWTCRLVDPVRIFLTETPPRSCLVIAHPDGHLVVHLPGHVTRPDLPGEGRVLEAGAAHPVKLVGLLETLRADALRATRESPLAPPVARPAARRRGQSTKSAKTHHGHARRDTKGGTR